MPGTDVQHSRCRLRVVCVWHGRHGQYMAPRRHEVIVAASLNNIGDRSAIDLKIENYVPSKVRVPQNDQTPTRLSGGGSNRDCANKNKNQKECIGRGVSWLRGPPLRSGLAFGERGVHCLVKFSEVVPAHQGLPGHPNCQSSPGVRHTLDGRRKTKSESHIAVYT